ncbi:MAG: hypothetical protein WAN48_06180 [Actinomycetes bacterium]
MNESKRAQAGTPSGGGIYGLGLIGAAVYYWRRADEGAASHALALGKAVAWPAFLVYQALEHTSRDN